MRTAGLLGATVVLATTGVAGVLWARVDGPIPPPAPPGSGGRYQVVQHWPVASPSLHVYLLDSSTGRMWMPMQKEDGTISWDLMARNDEPAYAPPEGEADEPGFEEAVPLWSAATPSPLPWEEPRNYVPMAQRTGLPPWETAKAIDRCVRQCLSWELEGTDLK